MTTNNSASPTTVRWDDPDGSWWIIAWDPDRGRYDATKFTHGDDGEERIVDDVGFGDRRITTVDELAAQMHRTLPPEVVDDLETAALTHPGDQPLFDDVNDSRIRPAASFDWDAPDGTAWGINWVPSHGGHYTATELANDGTGEVPEVTNVGFGTPLITTVDELATRMDRSLPEHLVHDLEEAAAAFPPTDLSSDRPMGTRYRIDLADSTWWELGWDKPLGTFFATRLADPDDDLGHKVVEDHGNGLSAISNLDRLAETIGRPIPPNIAQELAADAAAHPFTSVPRSMPEADMLVITPNPTDGSARQTELARWEARLRAQEHQLEAWAASLAAQNAVEPLWTLPTAPVVTALRNLQTDMAGDSDLATFATGLGLDSRLVEDLRANQLPAELDIDQIGQVCNALRCSPYDLWGPDLAQRTLHAYGPERWPSHIEPLADGRDLPSPADEFLARRLEAHAEAQVTHASPAPPVETNAPEPDDKPPRVLAVCYRREGLLAQEPSGAIREVDPGSDTSPDVEAYHFKFRQVMEPRDEYLGGVGRPPCELPPRPQRCPRPSRVHRPGAGGRRRDHGHPDRRDRDGRTTRRRKGHLGRVRAELPGSAA